MFFCTEPCEYNRRVPVTMFRPELPVRKLHLSIRACRSVAERVVGITFGHPAAEPGYAKLLMSITGLMLFWLNRSPPKSSHLSRKAGVAPATTSGRRVPANVG